MPHRRKLLTVTPNEVTTYGGERTLGGFRTVQHWQLTIAGRFIADTSDPRTADLYRKIVEAMDYFDAL